VQNANTRAQKIKSSGKLSDLYVQNRKNVGRVNNLSFEDIQKFKNLRKEVRVKTGAIKRKRKKTAYQVLTHTTKKENLHNILDSGKLMPIKHLKEQYPELEVNYEHKKGKTHRTSDKLKNIRNHHNSDKLFFAADRYDPRYGDYTIVKKLKKAEDNPVKWTLIPNEKIVKNPVSVRSNATIYVPNNELGE